MAVPTLVAGEPLAECLASLEKQTARDFEVIVIDNSGRRLVPSNVPARVIYNTHNVGFGAAINQAIDAADGAGVVMVGGLGECAEFWLWLLRYRWFSRAILGPKRPRHAGTAISKR